MIGSLMLAQLVWYFELQRSIRSVSANRSSHRRSYTLGAKV